MIALLFYKLGVLITRVFPLRFVYGLAALLSRGQAWIRPDLRQAVRSNLSHVLGEAAGSRRVAAASREVFRNFSYNVVDILRTPQLDAGRMQAAADVDGWEHMQRAYDSGRGVIMVSAHFGNWEWGGMLLAQRGLKVNAVALDHSSEQVTAFFEHRRAGQGIRTVPVEGSLFEIMKALHRGELVAIMADRDVAHQGTPARFFGTETLMPRAHASIAVKTGALIVPAVIGRRPGGRFQVRIAPAIEPGEPTDGAQEQVEELVDRCLRIVEGWIAADPGQWLVFEPIWPPAVSQG